MSRVIPGLNTIRLAAAIWVALSHGANLPLREMLGKDTLLTHAVTAANALAFNGAAAVMVFFIISGVCIHLPYAERGGAPLPSYLARRLIRIGLPLLAGGAVVSGLGQDAADAFQAVLWSLYCELAYYLIYPALRRLFRFAGLPACVAGAHLIAAVVIALNGLPVHPWEAGAATWLVFLPCWLWGCLLAERIAGERSATAPGRLAVWRSGMWLMSVAATALAVHSPIRIGLPIGLLVFAAAAAAWIERELAGPLRHSPGPLPEAAGEAAYSLYLVHYPVLVVVGNALAGQHPMSVWVGQLAGVGLATAGFHVMVERPSHALARRVGARLGQTPPSPGIMVGYDGAAGKRV